eukprot:TRINITY_DN2348_c0_g1_i1.p1 TRINITY_DN2348_c0_g1~~TRINITY_DN2348_c0_g1_i1.p1  ORF type:complete len:469 (-),score=72.59 TRINITY_DN2348_c0_g1_i1:1196-2602(-)
MFQYLHHQTVVSVMNPSGLKGVCGTLLIAALLLQLSLAVPLVWDRSDLTIPMRDGKSLAGDLYIPHTHPGGPLPVILVQTPYDKSLGRDEFANGVSDPLFNSANFAWVYVDWRGFFASAAANVSGYDRGLDGYDTVEWIAAQSWCTGSVGTWGSSALGGQQFNTLVYAPPHLKASVPRVGAISDTYEGDYPGGVYFENKLKFIQAYYYPTPIFKNNPLRNTFWDLLASSGNRSEIANAGVPILMVGGWFDLNVEVNIRDFARITALAPTNNKPKLLIGPWARMHIGDAIQGEYNASAAEWADSLQVLDFFNYYLRNDTSSNYPTAYPAVRYWTLGETVFRDISAWPPTPTSVLPLYFRLDYSLNISPSPLTSAYREYVSRPLEPMKTKFGRLLNETSGYGLQGAGDITEYFSRSDVLIYSTGALSNPESESTIYVKRIILILDLNHLGFNPIQKCQCRRQFQRGGIRK